MKNLSQKDIVIRTLHTHGKISRNDCLRMYISRLGAIMCTLKKEGMNIKAEWKDGDYVYTLMDKPRERIEYRVNGELVHTKVIY